MSRRWGKGSVGPTEPQLEITSPLQLGQQSPGQGHLEPVCGVSHGHPAPHRLTPPPTLVPWPLTLPLALLCSCLAHPLPFPDKLSWSQGFPDCSGQKQSPINIITEATLFSPQLQPIHLSGYNLPPSEQLTLKNNGHTGMCRVAIGCWAQALGERGGSMEAGQPQPPSLPLCGCACRCSRSWLGHKGPMRLACPPLCPPFGPVPLPGSFSSMLCCSP